MTVELFLHFLWKQGQNIAIAVNMNASNLQETIEINISSTTIYMLLYKTLQ